MSALDDGAAFMRFMGGFAQDGSPAELGLAGGQRRFRGGQRRPEKWTDRGGGSSGGGGRRRRLRGHDADRPSDVGHGGRWTHITPATCSHLPPWTASCVCRPRHLHLVHAHFYITQKSQRPNGQLVPGDLLAGAANLIKAVQRPETTKASHMMT